MLRKFSQISASKSMKVLLIGGGLTSSLLSSLLSEQLEGKIDIECWDKARGAGGRLSTSRSPSGSTVDLGAQYFSCMPQYAGKHDRFHKELIDAGILEPIKDIIEGESAHPVVVERGETQNYAAVNGASSIVKHFFKKAGVDVQCNRLVDRLTLTESKQWSVSAGDERSEFDGVVLTIPTPQILALQGTVADIINENKEVRTSLEHVEYSCRFALGLFYKSRLELPWTCKYVYDDPCVRFMAHYDKKRGKVSDESSVVVHTSVPFGLKHLEEDKEQVGQLVLQHLRQVAPELPPHDDVKYHKWRYSQVHKPYPGAPGCVVLRTHPLLLLTGDAFVHSNLDGCIEAALSAAKAVAENVS